ncbi:MAG: OmpA family protein [Prevotellaceae bacterium]|jgi:chemotaxis protein MotB|nr:OmpA family protein [Prevotellaceae bacterium]
MRKIIVISVITTSLVLAVSCSPIYKCGDPVPAKPNMFWGARLRAVIEERDTLCNRLSDTENTVDLLRKDTSLLAETTRRQNDSINLLQVEIDNMLATNKDLLQSRDMIESERSSESERFAQTLQQKENELAEKEILIAEREKSLQDMKDIIERKDSMLQHLNEVLRNALLGFKADELSVENKNGRVYVSMSDKLLFKSGSAEVENKGREALKALASVIVKNPDIDVVVEGHTDNDPIKTAVFKDNWDLSVIRATGIVRILVEEYSVQPKQVMPAGRGEFFPRTTNETAEGKAKNRRTEIILSPKLDELMKMLEAK